jgi:type II secretory pathway component PulF
MPRFTYRAKNNQGQIITGTVKADGEKQAEDLLYKHSLIPLELALAHENTSMSLFPKRVSLKDRALMTRQLSTMLSAGLPLIKSISLLAKQARNEHLKGLLLDIYKNLEQGYSLSSCLGQHPEAFDRVYISIVASGESTGKLDVVLKELAEELEKDQDFINKIMSSLYYPAFILVAMFGAGFLLLTIVVPKLKSVFEQAGGQLPMLTQMMISAGDFLQRWWWLLLILLVAGGIFLSSWLRTTAGSRFWHSLILKIPGLNKLFEGIYMYRFTRILSMLVGAGVPLLDALRIAASVIDNQVYEDSIAETALQVEKGVSLSSQLLRNPLFPQLIGQMTAVGEETGQLDVVLRRVSVFYEEETSNASKVISSLVEPFVLICVGLGVAFIVFAIYIPIYQVNQFVQ